MWSELITDLLEDIDVELSYMEKVQVRAVCVSWNTYLPKMPNLKLPQLPWLLQTVVDNEGTTLQGLFNIHEKKFYQIDLPEIRGKFLKGSSHGWLVMLSFEEDTTTTSNICLINPLTGAQIPLPPRSTFPDVVNYDKDKPGKEYCFESKACEGLQEEEYDDSDSLSEYAVLFNLTTKIITSSIPSNEDCVVVAIYGEQRTLAWCTPGQEEWTPLEIDPMLDGCVEDIIFSHDKLYAVNSNGMVLEVDNIGPNARVKVVVVERYLILDSTFLVESSDGSLVMINLQAAADDDDDDDDDDMVVFFEAYKIDWDNSCWRSVNYINNDLVFLGCNLTFSVSASQFPGYKGNCIYFTDTPIPSEYQSQRDKDVEIGVFDLEDGSVERISGFPTVHRSLWPQPVWVTPPTYS